MDAKEFHRLRFEAKITQKELADMMDMTERQVRNYELGITPIPFLVEKFMREILPIEEEKS